MASLYRKPTWTTDPASGERVKKLSRKWWGQFYDANGRLRRHPLATDKTAAQSMLSDLVKQAEREAAGLVDVTEEQRKRPLKQHLDDYKRHLQNKGVTPKQLQTVISQTEKMAAAAKWKFIGDISASGAMNFLGDLKQQGRSAQTRNHYLKSSKSFSAWLVRDRRTPTDPLMHLSRQNVAVDRRHDRRALSPEEFAALIEAARSGPPIEGIAGPDRAMLYMMAAWTGFRKGELGSLTLRSLNLDGNPPTATVAAGFSKRRRDDVQVLHHSLVAQLKAWLASKRRLKLNEPLFPISGRVPGCTDRKAHKMIRLDLAAARDKWVNEAQTAKQRRERDKSDFLAYCDHSGRYADFHSLRHTFITQLAQAGISPRMAQTLARHSDIRLTLQTYTHVDLGDQVAAIQSLTGPTSKVVAG
jgi:integrase